MKIPFWVYATKDRPTRLVSQNGELQDEFGSETAIFPDKALAEQHLNDFDAPERFILLSGEIEV